MFLSSCILMKPNGSGYFLFQWIISIVLVSAFGTNLGNIPQRSRDAIGIHSNYWIKGMFRISILIRNKLIQFERKSIYSYYYVYS